MLGFAVDTIWFREDDLGTILGGVIRSWRDVIRVFSSDCRSFISPANYQRTTPNVISGFLRPMQNVVFSVVYFFWGADARAYYLMHIAFHAANASLLFILLSYWLPISISCLAGFALAFYPSVSWLTWHGTLQNSLAVFFLLLAVMVVIGNIRFILKLKTYALGSFAVAQDDVIPREARNPGLLVLVLFLCSLLSRETTILLPLWFLLGAYWFGPPLMVRSEAFCRASRTITHTWPFFAAGIAYFFMRLASFGITTLLRTMRNISLRFPWLAQYLGEQAHVVTSGAVDGAATGAPSSIAHVAQGVVSDHAGHCSFVWRVTEKIIERLIIWLEPLFNLSAIDGAYHKYVMLVLPCALGAFLWFAYRGQRRLLLWLSFGFLCTIWPGVLAYPNPRYLNLSYPFLVTLIIVGIYLSWQQQTRLLRLAAGVVLTGALALTVIGLSENRHGLYGAAASSHICKQRFTDFFARYHFSSHAQFVVLSSPYVSDIQHIFQALLGNLNTVLVFDPFCTLAERGVMGCRDDYRTVGVESVVTLQFVHKLDPELSLRMTSNKHQCHSELCEESSFHVRLTSADPAHCGWWLRHSDYPIRWVPKTRSYEWTTEPYRPGRWYPCSIGNFFIHAMTSDDCVSDITFAIDPRWVTTDTVFVAWNTTRGRYEVIESKKI